MPITNVPGQPPYGTTDHAAQITQGRHPGVQTAMAWLCFSHLPTKLQRFCEPLYAAAWQLLRSIPADSAELTSAMNRLVEAKDWYMRAGIRSDEGQPGPIPRPTTVVDPPTNWAETARDLISGDQERVDKHLPQDNWNSVPRLEEECMKGIGHVGGCGCLKKMRAAGQAPGECPGCGKKLTAHGFHPGTGRTTCS